MMTPREIIKRNLNRTAPERIGMQFGGQGRIDDMISAGVGSTHGGDTKTWTEDNFEYSIDIWGNTWYRIIGMSQAGEIFKPAIEDWSQLSSFELPDMANPENFKDAGKQFAEDTEHFRLARLPGFPFAICRYLRKMEIYFEDLLLERENIDELHSRVTDLLEKIIIQFGEADADGIMFWEDWGTQHRLLISPAMWRDIFKPLFKRLCDKAHEYDMHVLMHSCGYIWEIIDDLAEVGVNALQLDQPALFGLEPLAEKLQNANVCLYSPADIQRVMPSGDRDRIVSEAKQMVKLFGGQSGGLIAKNYPDLHGIGVEEEWDRWAYDAFEENMRLPAIG